MTSPSRFAAWQEANQKRREDLISEYLRYLAKTRVRVRNPTDLADLVARHIAHVEDAPCNKATLMRNRRYKAKILSYQAQHREPGSRSLNERDIADPSTARALLITSKLEAGNLRRQIERLNIHIKSLEENAYQQRHDHHQLSGPPAAGAEPTVSERLSDYEFKFIRTCQALRAVMSHMDLVLAVDTEARQILDRSKRRNNVVVDREIAGPFLEWLSRVSGGA